MSLLGQDEDEKDTRLDDLMETLREIKEKQDREVPIIICLFSSQTLNIGIADCLCCAVNLCLTAHLHCRKWTRVQTQIQIPNLMATLYYTEHVHIAQTQIPTPYFCKGQESESESSVSGNVNEP